MSRPVGLPKTGGRKKGTPNKSSVDLEEALWNFGFDPLKKIIELIPDMPIEKQATTCLELLKYIYIKKTPATQAANSCTRCAANDIANLTDSEIRERSNLYREVLGLPARSS